MGLPKEIADLIERFDRNRDNYKGGQYNEAQLRQDFLNPFLGALGWDMTNKAGYAEAYRDVIHEDAIKIGGATKAPDYCFRIGSVKKFFVEAKKPSVNLKDDISPAFQLRRYAWSAKLPLSILTDFEEFAVYDCRIKPVQTDKASTGRVLYFTYKDYPAKWDELVNIFSREAVLKGSFDKYAESSKLKKGTATVDDAFLTEIEDWRGMLAKNIALRNADLTTRELNFAVQRTIDRIVFLRICEDRGIEEYGRLQTQLNGTNVYKRLVQLFSQADDRYNSGLFHFQREKERHEEPDKLTPNISIDDKPLKDIINRLYYPESPYEFSVLSADILGQVYEQFLGKVIRLTAGHQAKVEEKPEVRKAGGVYYTPKYIVDYIVKNTVGTLLGDGDRVSGIGNSQYPDSRPPITEPHTGGANVDTNIQGFGSLAGVDESDNRGLSIDESISKGRDLRIDQPNAAGCGFNPGQYSGGAQPEIEKGIPSSRVDCAGFTGGVGNTSLDCQQAGVSGDAGLGQGLGNSAAGRTIDQRSASLSPIPEPRQLTPKQVSRLKILDPACGSGSFLLGAYQYLLDWHLKWYIGNEPDKWAKQKNPAIYRGTAVADWSSGTGDQGSGTAVPTAANRPPTPVNWNLTTSEKKRILLNNIYGVDIDSQAVEVTKLSLLLKVLEGENNQTLANQLRMFHERALPDLGDNIKCGNSLIGPDFYQQQTMLDDEERYRVNVFDWGKEFSEITKAGGFDAVIGNPPYIRMEGFKPIKDYLKNKYKSHEERADIYAYFLERGINMLNSLGSIGMIVSNKFMKAKYGRPLRKVFADSATVNTIADLAGADVFQSATVRTVVIIAQRAAARKSHDILYVPVPDHGTIEALRSGRVSLDDYALQKAIRLDSGAVSENGWQLLSKDNTHLLEKLRINSLTLKEWVGSSALFGSKTGLNDAFIIDAAKRKELIGKHATSKEIIQPILFGKDVRRYYVEGGRQYVIYCHPNKNIDYYPAVRDHLALYKQDLVKRATKQSWYELQQPATSLININLRPKIVYPIIANECRFTLDTEGYYINDKVFLLPSDDLTLIGILNSRIANFYFGAVCAALEGSTERYLEFRAQYVDKYPIPKKLSKWDKKITLEKLVTQMLALKKQIVKIKTDHEKTSLQRQIDAADHQIDQLVYELYELTEEEIRTVENKK
jgi:hypothetical protein